LSGIEALKEAVFTHDEHPQQFIKLKSTASSSSSDFNFTVADATAIRKASGAESIKSMTTTKLNEKSAKLSKKKKEAEEKAERCGRRYVVVVDDDYKFCTDKIDHEEEDNEECSSSSLSTVMSADI
jgi:hypothetical protein